jgi:hypothetical protein
MVGWSVFDEFVRIWKEWRRPDRGIDLNRAPPQYEYTLSGQSCWLQIQRTRVRFPALPDFLRSSGSGTWSTQPREYNWRAEKVSAPV